MRLCLALDGAKLDRLAALGQHRSVKRSQSRDNLPVLADDLAFNVGLAGALRQVVDRDQSDADGGGLADLLGLAVDRDFVAEECGLSFGFDLDVGDGFAVDGGGGRGLLVAALVAAVDAPVGWSGALPDAVLDTGERVGTPVGDDVDGHCAVSAPGVTAGFVVDGGCASGEDAALSVKVGPVIS